jgi:hypothetical protein
VVSEEYVKRIRQRGEGCASWMACCKGSWEKGKEPVKISEGGYCNWSRRNDIFVCFLHYVNFYEFRQVTSGKSLNFLCHSSFLDKIEIITVAFRECEA